MKGTSKVIMGATLVMVLSLAIVLGLVLVLLAELYCSLLLRRRQIKNSKNQPTAPTTTTTTPNPEQYPSPLTSFYSQGVLHAPRSFFFPILASTTTTTTREAAENQAGIADDVERQHGKLHQFLSLQAALDNSPPTTHGGKAEQLVYISNPIYGGGGGDHTPFETPDSSPSRLERGRGSSEGDDSKETPPLTPMKELPAKASSIALASGSESTSQNAAFSSTSYSGSPSTSSWCS